MVLILDGNSELGAHARSNLCYSTCLINRFFQLDRKQSRIGLFSLKSSIFPHACATCSELPYDISTMIYLMVSIFFGHNDGLYGQCGKFQNVQFWILKLCRNYE